MNTVAGGGKAPTRRGPWGKWVDWLSKRELGTALALFRMAVGLCVIGSIGSVVLHGLVADLWLDPQDGGYTEVSHAPWQFGLAGGLNPGSVHLMLVIVLVCSTLLTIGVAGRLAAFVTLQSYLALVGINEQVTGSYDLLISNALWLLVLAQSTATLSVACRWRTGKWASDRLVPAWPRYLAIFQLVLVYWSTGMHKLSAYWLPGGGFSALYYILQQPTWQRWDLSWVAWVYPLTQIGTAVTWFFEITSPLLLLAFWYRNTSDRGGWLRKAFNWINFRRIFVLSGVILHALIFVLMDVGPFSWIALSFYFCLYHPEEWQAGWHRLRR